MHALYVNIKTNPHDLDMHGTVISKYAFYVHKSVLVDRGPVTLFSILHSSLIL